ncbi:COG3179 Predicted chitinase [uncultured Caudovirales phage]|uniref:COG3179 Predicted chitinase n=1 Tax=uncultured Caudovirales phage TaxID=2100421 RepID=A0A6J5QZV8_9CAUD|nr:COG3179 Predicted chitinase [uncultured Caudovirales phage]
MLTPETLKRIMPLTRFADRFAPLLEATCQEFDISTPERRAAFLSQLAHESAQMNTTREYASGEMYEGREDLGNTHEGDGRRFRGRGLIQLTGRANYTRYSQWAGIDYVRNPEWLERPEDACRVSGWFWDSHGLNELADEGDFKKITRRINGGTNGWADREQFWQRAKIALGC